jgi:hypothetical protein
MYDYSVVRTNEQKVNLFQLPSYAPFMVKAICGEGVVVGPAHRAEI